MYFKIEPVNLCYIMKTGCAINPCLKNSESMVENGHRKIFY